MYWMNWNSSRIATSSHFNKPLQYEQLKLYYLRLCQNVKPILDPCSIQYQSKVFHWPIRYNYVYDFVKVIYSQINVS